MPGHNAVNTQAESMQGRSTFFFFFFFLRGLFFPLLLAIVDHVRPTNLHVRSKFLVFFVMLIGALLVRHRAVSGA